MNGNSSPSPEATPASFPPLGWWWAEPGRLLVGSHPCREAEGGAHWLQRLAEHGFTHILSLNSEKEELSWPFPELPAGMERWRLPIEDYDIPDNMDLIPAVRRVQFVLSNKSARVFVHCMGGCGRSGYVAGSILVALKACPGKEIQSLLDQRRREAGLTADCPETLEQRVFLKNVHILFL